MVRASVIDSMCSEAEGMGSETYAGVRCWWIGRHRSGGGRGICHDMFVCRYVHTYINVYVYVYIYVYILSTPLEPQDPQV